MKIVGVKIKRGRNDVILTNLQRQYRTTSIDMAAVGDSV